jgi:hypothetical protein
MIAVSAAGAPGFNCTGETGALCNIASNNPAVVEPVNGRAPVAISYSTTPKENDSSEEFMGKLRLG